MGFSVDLHNRVVNTGQGEAGRDGTGWDDTNEMNFFCFVAGVSSHLDE
jgi:hypothetical protein